MPEIQVCREQILSEEYVDFIISQFERRQFAEFLEENSCRQEALFSYESIYVEQERAVPISFGVYPYNSIPKCYTLQDTQAMYQAGILQIQEYPTLNLQGTNVLIGLIDTGIDYQNPVFRNLDGSTRVLAIWDQTIQEGEPPEGFFYGSEYRAEQIDEALRSEAALSIVPSVDETSHGTFLASIAAGGANEENQFIGAAPDATIAMVKLKPAKSYLKQFYEIHTNEACYQENDIMLGVTYLHRLAERADLPLVLCIALGTNLGGHSGFSPLAGLLEILANTENRIIIIGAGNEADQRHHYQGIAQNINEEKEIEIRVPQQIKGFCGELWTENPNILAVTVVSPSGERSFPFSVQRKETSSYRFVLEGTVVEMTTKLFLERSNSELIFFRFRSPTEGIWKIVVQPIQIAEGLFHIWLPVRKFLESDLYFLESDPNTTFTEPGSVLSAITVGFYDGDDNSVAISSGRGYTRSNVVKPNFVAPGVEVLGAVMRNQFARRTGSSIAAGITAGAAALLVEWILYQLREESVDSIQIRSLLTLGTERNPNEIYPNRTWGYGRLNLFRVFDEIRRF